MKQLGVLTCVIFLLVVGLVVGCAPAPPPEVPEEVTPEETVVEEVTPPEEEVQVKTIEFWDMQQSDLDILAAQEAALAAFEAANPDIKVNVTVFPYPEYRDKLLIAVQGGKAPDISTLDQIWTSEFAAAGSIIPVDDYISASDIVKEELFFPGAWASNVYKGKTYGVPLNNDVWEELYYNKDLFKAAGLDPEKPPTTWDELLEMSRKLNDPPNIYGIALMGGKGEFTICTIDSFIYSNGGYILDPATGKVVFNSPEVIEALKFYKSLEEFAPPGTVNRDEAEAVNLFTAGKAAMALLGSWQQDTIRQRAPDMSWGVAMVPVPEGKTFHGTLGGWSLSIYEQSEHKDAAWKYIEFLAGKDVQKAVSSLIPARLDAGKEFIEEKREGPDVIFNTVNSGYPRPISPVYPRISDIQTTMMQAIWTGTPVEEAVAKAAEAIEEIVAEMP
jgi:multiple sugar transport system substrate-binding protein